MPKFTIRTANVTSGAADIGFDLLVSAWAEVEKYFKGRLIPFDEKHSIAVTVDASNIIEMLENLREENCKAYFDRLLKERTFETLEEFHELQPLGGNLVIELKSSKEFDKHEIENFLIRFIEQLFLSMNVAQYASCNFYGAHILEFKNYLSGPMSLSVEEFEQIWYVSKNWNWPKLQTIPFTVSWEWFSEQNARGFVVAETPVQKALVMLLHLSQKGEYDAMDLVSVSLVLESFFVSKNERKVQSIKRKIKALLGEPFKERSWIDKFYNIRSDIVHGDYPIIRPGYSRNDESIKKAEIQVDEIMEYTYKGIAVILAILQDLIISSANSYEFKESISVQRHKNG